jgi:hypothetical protein
MAFAATWLEIMPSVIGRRPKGVVAIPVSISFFAFQSGKRNPLADTTL